MAILSDPSCLHANKNSERRYRGDEFVVLLHGQDLEKYDEILRAFDACVEGNIPAKKVVVSCGVSLYRPEEDHNFHDVFERADNLMYRRKQELKSMGAITRE